MKVVDSAAGINRIPAVYEHDHDEESSEHGADESSETDPHIWFSPSRMKQMAQTMADAMKAADPQNADFYQSNLETLLVKIDETDAEVRAQLEGAKRDHFMVVHPAWGYVAADYGLQMLAVEIGGNEPAPVRSGAGPTWRARLSIAALALRTGTDAATGAPTGATARHPQPPVRLVPWKRYSSSTTSRTSASCCA